MTATETVGVVVVVIITEIVLVMRTAGVIAIVIKRVAVIGKTAGTMIELAVVGIQNIKTQMATRIRQNNKLNYTS